MKFLLICAAAAGLALAQETFTASPVLDAAIDQAVRDGLIPGAVLVVGRDGKILHRKAYGQRALVPEREPMTIDTMFDAASLKKLTLLATGIDASPGAAVGRAGAEDVVERLSTGW